MWEKVKTFCLYSATIGWSYILLIVGSLLEIVDALPDVTSDPTISYAIKDVFGDNPALSGKIILAISIVNILARLRSIRKAMKDVGNTP